MEESPVKNSIYNVAYRFLNVLFPLITVTYVSRVLQADGVGRISYAQNIVSYFTMLAPLGLLSYGTREIAKVRNGECAKVFSELLVINALSTAFFSVLYVLVIHAVPRFYSDVSLYYTVGITLFFNVFNIDWLYQGLEQYRYIAYRSMAVKGLCLVLIFLFVKTREDYLAYAFISAFGTVGNYCLNILGARRRVRFTFGGLRLKRHLLPVMLLASSAVAVELYNAIGVTILGFVGTDTQVGLFSNANKIVRLIQSVISAIGAVLLPRLSYCYMMGDQENADRLVNKALKVMMLITVPSSVGLICVADDLIPVLFGETFHGAIVTMRILALVLPVLVLNVLYGIQVLIAAGQDKKYLFTVCLGAGMGLVLNLPLICLFAQNGAAMASLLCELSVSVCTIRLAKNYARFDRDFKCYRQIGIASLVMGMGVCLVKTIFPDAEMLISLFVSVLVGGSLYVCVLVLLRNPVLGEILGLFLKRGVD